MRPPLPEIVHLRGTTCTMAARPSATASSAPGRAPRRFTGVAYTGAEVDLGLWGRAIFRMDGIAIPNGKFPCLRQHDPLLIAGFVERATKGTELRVEGILGDTRTAREVADLADSGFPWQMSVGLGVREIEDVAPGRTVTINGRTFSGAGVVISASVLKEVSFVPMGADSSTTAVVLAGTKQGSERPFLAAWKKAVGAAQARGLTIEAAKREVAIKHRGLHLGLLAEASGWPIAEVHPWVERERARR